MAIDELEVFPQITFGEGQGMIGTRRWSLDYADDLYDFLRKVCGSHFPNYPDSIPVQVQSGPFWEGVKMIPGAESETTRETLGPLMQYGKMLVVAQYALHRMTNCWPDAFHKPRHPVGTTLTLKVRGSGQALLITVAGMRVLNPVGACTKGMSGVSPMGASKMIVPVAEYHVTCDRMTKDQVDAAMAVRDWRLYLGSVNKSVYTEADLFLGGQDETVLLDGFEITETSVCDVDQPNRYAMNAIFKHRVITNADGTPLHDANGNPVGWNHDYVGQNDTSGKPIAQWAWTRITMMQGSDCVPRYTPMDFSGMFGGPLLQDCNANSFVCEPQGTRYEVPRCRPCTPPSTSQVPTNAP